MLNKFSNNKLKDKLDENKSTNQKYRLPIVIILQIC